MRKLSMKQKQLIAKQGKVTPALLAQLEKVNDYETLWSDAQRFADDLMLHRKQHTIYRVMNYNQAKFDEEKYIKDWR
jgi:hypothetical protein